MLRVGLTGDLGSGKSTVAQMLRAKGAHVFSSDDMARAMMQPGHAVYDRVVAAFGEGVLQAGSRELDRSALARLAFAGGRVEELNAIVHPAVIAEQARLIETLAAEDPGAIVVVESALLFTTRHGSAQASDTAAASDTAGVTLSEPKRGRKKKKPTSSWQQRFDEILVVTAPEPAKLERFVERAAQGRKVSAAERAAMIADAKKRLALQHFAPDADCIILRNDRDLITLQQRVDAAWIVLWRKANR
jgi:dephospho-CoA kinase